MGTVRYTVIDGEVIAEKRNGVRSLYVPDPLGSTVALLDNTQAKTDTFSYWPYGKNDARTGTTATPFQFVGTAGYYRDSGSRAYVRARTLDTQKTRWISKDPLRSNMFNIARGFDRNLYRYVWNKPMHLVDRTGLNPFIIGVGIGIVIGVGLQLYACYSEGMRWVRYFMKEPIGWPHNHSGTPFGGDKLVHCLTMCMLGKDVGDWCAEIAAEHTGDSPGDPGADPNDHKANLNGVRCSRQCGTGNHWLDCQKCCHEAGYRRWK